MLHAFTSPAVYLALAGVVTAWYLYLKRPDLPALIAARFARLYRLLVNKYYFDWFNENVVAAGVRSFGTGLWRRGDESAYRRRAGEWHGARDRRDRRASSATCRPATCTTTPSR